MDETIVEVAPHIAELPEKERMKWNIEQEQDRRLKNKIVRTLKKRLGIKSGTAGEESFFDTNVINFHNIEIYGANFQWGWFLWNEYNLNHRGLDSYVRSLYEIDRDEALYQHNARMEEFDKLSPEERATYQVQREFVYDYPYLYYWLRTRRKGDDVITYMNVVSLHGWICDKIEEAMWEYMENRYQWEFVSGPEDGKKTGPNQEFVVWDQSPQPADPSLKDEFAAAYEISHRYEREEGYKEIGHEIASMQIRGCALIPAQSDNNADNEKNANLIIADVDTLKEIRPESFFEDIARIEIDRKIDLEKINAIIDSKVKGLISEIEALRGEKVKRGAISCSCANLPKEVK